MRKDEILNEYISSVSSHIVCPPVRKKDFLNQLGAEVEAYIDENENATPVDIENVFGTPESIAASFIMNTDSTKLKKKISLKRLIAAAVITVLLIYLAFVVISLIDVHFEAHGYMEEGIIPAAVYAVKECAL